MNDTQRRLFKASEGSILKLKPRKKLQWYKQAKAQMDSFLEYVETLQNSPESKLMERYVGINQPQNDNIPPNDNENTEGDI